MDTLENWIKNNRDGLDKEQPPKLVWENIHEQLDGEQIEQFVNENRSDFDNETPSKAGWNIIHGRLDCNKIERFVDENREGLNDQTPSGAVWKAVSAKLDESQLEMFVQSNQDGLETELPSEGIWEKISNKLDENQIEGFVQKNKAAISNEQPPQETWPKIEDQLPENEVDKPRKLLFQPVYKVWARRVAVAASFFMLGFLVQYLMQPTAQVPISQPIAAEQSTPPTLDPELQKAEEHYLSQIAIQVKQVNNMGVFDQELSDDFMEQISMLDEAYKDLKDEVAQGRPVDRLATSIIQNLQMQVEILNRQIDILTKIKNSKTQQENVQI